jgi:hypothetical protein
VSGNEAKVRPLRKIRCAGPQQKGPAKKQGQVYWMEAPKGRERRISVGQEGKVRLLCKFPVQNHLHPHQTNATNFVLVLIGLSLPYRIPHPIKAKAPSTTDGAFSFVAPMP